jgi:hypothetical protein
VSTSSAAHTSPSPGRRPPTLPALPANGPDTPASGGHHTGSGEGHHSPPPVARATLVATAIVALQAVLLLAFAWPALETAPRDVPMVVAGPAAAADQVAASLESAPPGAFEVTRVDDAAAAEQALRDREAYGAVVLGPDGPTMLVAGAASPAVAQLLTTAAQQQAAAEGRTADVVDVVPADPDDPRGVALTAGLLPIVMTSIAAGAVLALVVRRRGAVLVGLLAYSALAGLAVTAILQLWFDALPGSYLVNAGVVALLALAMSAAVAGATAVAGRIGLVVTAATIFLLGNPLSGLASAPEMLPQPWGALGQLLPPGAGGSMLRSVAWFDGAAAALPVWVLATWALAGLLLVAVAPSRTGELTAGGEEVEDREPARS